MWRNVKFNLEAVNTDSASIIVKRGDVEAICEVKVVIPVDIILLGEVIMVY